MVLVIIEFPQNKADFLYNLFATKYKIYRIDKTNALIAVDEENNMFFLTKQNVCSVLRNLYFQQAKQTISNEPINNAWYMIDSISNSCDDYITFVDLLYQENEFIIYNIINSSKYIQVRKNECNLCEKTDSGMLFKTYKTTNNLIQPDLNATMDDLFAFIDEILNLSEKDRLLVIVYIVSLFLSNINHPILFAIGDYGAAKTTTLKMIGNILYPYNCNVVSLPHKEDETAVIISNSVYTVFDNVSYINRSLADLLCLSVTSGTYSKRELYTNSNVTELDIHKPVAISTINRSFKFFDLIDRSIVIELKRIPPERMLTEQEIWSRFYSLLPKIQGCIFKILSVAMAKYDLIKISKYPRLADFAKWGYAIAEAIEEGNGDAFLKQYKDNLNFTFKNSITENPLLNTIEVFMSSKESWEGTASELLLELKKLYQQINVTNIIPVSFPSAANVLTRQINSSINELKILGISVETTRSTTRKIKLTNFGGNNNGYN